MRLSVRASTDIAGWSRLTTRRIRRRTSSSALCILARVNSSHTESESSILQHNTPYHHCSLNVFYRDLQHQVSLSDRMSQDATVLRAPWTRAMGGGYTNDTRTGRTSTSSSSSCQSRTSHRHPGDACHRPSWPCAPVRPTTRRSRLRSLHRCPSHLMHCRRPSLVGQLFVHGS